MLSSGNLYTPLVAGLQPSDDQLNTAIAKVTSSTTQQAYIAYTGTQKILYEETFSVVIDEEIFESDTMIPGGLMSQLGDEWTKYYKTGVLS